MRTRPAHHVRSRSRPVQEFGTSARGLAGEGDAYGSIPATRSRFLVPHSHSGSRASISVIPKGVSV